MRKTVFFIFLAGIYLHAQRIDNQELLSKCRKEFNKKICLSDEDNDSLLFYLDKCPKEEGPVENDGCPWPDTDKDGVIDKDDICSTVPGPVENKGCPWEDTDGDGILDKDDNCPTVPGPAYSNGCRAISCTFGNEPNIRMEKFEMDVQNIEKIYDLVNKKVLDNIVQARSKKDFTGRKTYFLIEYIDHRSYLDSKTPDDGTSPGYNLLITRFWNQNILEYIRKTYGKDIYISTSISPDYLNAYHKIIGDKTFGYMMKHYDSKYHKIKIAGKQPTTLENPIHIMVNFITPYKLKVMDFQSVTLYEYKNNQWESHKE